MRKDGFGGFGVDGIFCKCFYVSGMGVCGCVYKFGLVFVSFVQILIFCLLVICVKCLRMGVFCFCPVSWRCCIAAGSPESGR